MTTAIKERKPTYKIFVLDSEEYDSLHRHYPMKKEDLEGSLGFASAKTKEAFIRRTNVPEWDEATILHEAEELLAKHSEHEDENNIRWKKGKDIFSKIIPMVVGGIVTALTGGGTAPLLGPLMASLAGGAASAGTSAITQKNMGSAGTINPLEVGLSGLGSALSGGGLISGVNASKAAGGGLLGQTLSGMQGAVGITPGAASKAATGGIVTGGNSLANTFNASQAASPLLGSQVSLGGNLANITGGVSRGLTAAAPALSSLSSISNIGTNLLGNTPKASIPGVTPANTVANQPSQLTSAFNATQPTKPFEIPTSLAAPNAPAVNLPAIQATQEVAPQSGILAGLGKKVGELATPQNILGGAMTLGSTMGKQPEYQPVDIESIRNTLLSGQGVTPLAQQARAKLSQIMSAKPGDLYPTGTDAYYQSALRQTEVAYQDAQKNLAKRYNMIDPNYQQNGEYQDLARKLDQELANVKSDYAISEEQRRFELSRTQQYQAIQQALQVDDATMQELLGFTNLSVDQAAKKYQVDVNDINEMRKALGGLGGQLLSSPGGILAGTQQ